MIPALPPRHRRLRSLLLPLATAAALAGGLGYLVSIWPAPEPFVVPRDRPVTLAPLSSVYTAVHEGPRCLAALDDFVRRPNWQLTLTLARRGCSHDVIGSLTVDAAGDAAWSTYGLPARPLHLTATQLDKLRAAASLSCEPPSKRTHIRFVSLQWGAAGTPGMQVDESEAQAQLEAFVDDALAHYRSRRLAERPDFSATFTVPPDTLYFTDLSMTVSFDARGRMQVTVGRRTIAVENVDIVARVDAIDWLELGGLDALPMPMSLEQAIDRATFDARRHPDWRRD